jgi:vancomycin resistance protein YoaR
MRGFIRIQLSLEGCSLLQIKITKRANLLLFFVIIVLFSSTSLLAANAAFAVSDNIYGGVFVGDIPVGGLSLAQAKQVIQNHFSKETAAAPVIILYYQGRTWKVNRQDIHFAIETDDLAQQAYNIGRTGNILQRLKARYLALNHGTVVPIKIIYDKDKLAVLLTKIAAAVDQKPKNALLTFNPQTTDIQLIPETLGSKVDITKTMGNIALKLNMTLPARVDLSVDEVKPAVVSKDLAGINGLLAVYTTQFNSAEKNRSLNIALAAAHVNKVLVRSGAVFSFNKQVGLRLPQYGYKEAPVYIDGDLVPGWGGGVCQVSSTLYNAALLADMKIVERSPHFHPPGYVPLGQDATVADHLLDMKFKNTSSHNIYLLSRVAGNQLTIYILGKSNPGAPEIRIVSSGEKVLEPNVVIKQDPNLRVGQEVVDSEGEEGFEISTYRIKLIKGKEVGRELLSTDRFDPSDRVIRVGSESNGQSK